MACVYDNTLADDCSTPLSPSDQGALSAYSDLGTYNTGQPSSVPSGPTSLLSQVQAAQQGTPSGPVSPVAASAGASGSGGPGFFASILNFGTSVAAKFVPTSAQTGLQLRVNPATGQNQYYNPSTGMFVGGAVSSNTSGLSSLFSGSNLLLVLGAVVIVLFIFLGKKR